MIPASSTMYQVLIDSAGWKDIEDVIRERIKAIQVDLNRLGNPREFDIELKARIAELQLVLKLPYASKALVELYVKMKENEDARDDKQSNGPQRQGRSGPARDDAASTGDDTATGDGRW